MKMNALLATWSLLLCSAAEVLPDLPGLGEAFENNSISPAEAFAERSYFYVGGDYVNGSGTGTVMTGQIYVERLVPQQATKRHPLVFIAGAAQTGANWLNTPDGREGWASYFLRQGYVVYLTDQPQRGRSPWQPDEGVLATVSTEFALDLFIAPQKVSPLPYPQAIHHTQWPGNASVGDPIFDAFFASQVQYQAEAVYTAKLNNRAYTALLKKIGSPVLLVTHSQAGPFGWQLADTIPSLIQGLVAIEPGSTPFETWTGPPFTKGYLTPFPPMPYGVTFLPVHYDPSIGHDPSLLKLHNVSAPRPDLAPCMLQREPARQLVNICKVPQLHIVSQASWHAVEDHCVAAYLKQAGCDKYDYVPLESVGIHGNGHFLFMESNNLEIAAKVVLPWLEKVAA